MLAPQSGTTLLQVPADDCSPAMVGSAAATAMVSAGLSDMAATEVRCVVEALCVDAVLRCAEGPDLEPSIELRIQRVPGGMELTLRDKGLPIASDRSAIRRAKQLAGIGFVDHLSIVPISPEGPTSTMTVALPAEVLHPTLHQTDPGEVPESAAGSDSAASSVDVEEVPFTVRTMVPGDAAAYARLVYRCYGYDYKHSAYEPEGVDAGLTSGLQLAAIAEGPDGEMIGHVAYRRLRAGSPVVEGGAGMVDARFRNRGVLKAMGTHLHEAIGTQQVNGILSEPVMVHMATQRMAHLVGFDTGVFLQYSNPRLVTGFDSQDKSERVSVLCSYIPLAPMTERSIYPPISAHRHVATVVEQSALVRTVLAPQEPSDVRGPSVLSTHADAPAGVVRIEVHQAGPDLIEHIIGLLDDLVATGVSVIHLDLPANDPDAGWYASGIGQLGFVYCALLPDCGDDGDVLRLQYLTDTTIHMDDWQIDLPATADLVHAIIGDLHTWEQGEITARQERVESWRTAALQQS